MILYSGGDVMGLLQSEFSCHPSC